jgi:hypothetical protein
VNQFPVEIPGHGSACLTDLEAVDDVRFEHVCAEGAAAVVAVGEVRCDVRSHVVSGFVDWRFD